MKRYRIGIFGVGRGMDIAKNFMLLNCEIVAVCDFHKHRLAAALAKLDKDTAAYEDFDSFIEHPMDAVILANYFHEHAPYAIKALARGIHVFSECISNGTMAEGVELIRAAEKSDAVYFLAENYPQMLFNREMKRIVDSGTLGKILYAEGEYNHPSDPWNDDFRRDYNYFEKHWRNYLPRTYYITHSLGPIMRATGATPRVVTAFSVYAPTASDVPSASCVADRTSIVTMQNDDGSVYRVTGCAALGGHHNAYRVCGTEGQIENLRGMGEQVMLRYNDWTKPSDQNEINLYTPEWNDKDEELIKTSGHGGGDYLTARAFLECIEKGCQPEHPYHVHAAVAMSSVAILAHRSVLAGGKPFEIPDFHTEEARLQYENDRETPFFGTDGSAPTIPCCSDPTFAPSEKNLELYRRSLEK